MTKNSIAHSPRAKNLQPNKQPAESSEPQYKPDPTIEAEACELRAKFWQLQAEAWRLRAALDQLGKGAE
jgi:hypothetical protein